jgi:hypothetical protein
MDEAVRFLNVSIAAYHSIKGVVFGSTPKRRLK